MKRESPGDASGGGRRRVNPRSRGKNPSSRTRALPCSLPCRPARPRYLRTALPASRHTHTGRLRSRRRVEGLGRDGCGTWPPTTISPPARKDGRREQPGRRTLPPPAAHAIAPPVRELTGRHRLPPLPVRSSLSGRRSAPWTIPGARGCRRNGASRRCRRRSAPASARAAGVAVARAPAAAPLPRPPPASARAASAAVARALPPGESGRGARAPLPRPLFASPPRPCV